MYKLSYQTKSPIKTNNTTPHIRATIAGYFALSRFLGSGTIHVFFFLS